MMMQYKALKSPLLRLFSIGLQNSLFAAPAHDLAEQRITAEQTLVQSLSSTIISLFNCKIPGCQYNLFSTV